MYKINQAEIIRLNPGCEEKIYAGQTLKIPQSASKEKKEDIFHTIQAGENLYRLTQKYNVSSKEIIEENPGLSAENFRIGQVVRIPAGKGKAVSIKKEEEFVPIIPAEVKPKCRDMHKVKRKETIFSVSQKYGITEKELIDANPELKQGMKKGRYVCIPYPKTEKEKKEEQRKVTPPSNQELFAEAKEKTHRISPIRAAIILPFSQSPARREESGRMVEYYEGFLLAMDSLKRQNVSIDLHVYDSGDEKSSIASILSKPEMKKMDIIFGPLYQQHISPLVKFTADNEIRLVIPFTSKDNEVFRNPNVYLINTPQSYLYSEVYDKFGKQFPDANVILLDGFTDKKDKEEFIRGLETDLVARGVPVSSVGQDNLSVEVLKSMIRPGKSNIFIPTTASDVALIKAIPQLKLLVRDNPEYKIHLFGYPEWQTYTKDYLESFFELDTYFYSTFYTNNLLPSAVSFINKYHMWYSKEMANRYPKFGMLGFDIGYFFLSGLARYGTELENNLPKMSPAFIQTGFNFERVNNWGGFINKKVFFVNFTKDFEVIKMEF